jgi:hypothetical protein
MVCVDIDVWTKLSPRSLYQYLLEEPSHREAWVPFLHSPSLKAEGLLPLSVVGLVQEVTRYVLVWSPRAPSSQRLNILEGTPRWSLVLNRTLVGPVDQR